MKIDYDGDTDTLTIAIREEGQVVADSIEDPEGVILDYSAKGELLSIEILDASQHVAASAAIELVRGR